MNRNRHIRLAQESDIPAIMCVIDMARQIMHNSGNTNQWINGYPSDSIIRDDIIILNAGFVIEENRQIIGYFAFIPSPEPTYSFIKGKWLNDEPYYVIHRMASLPEYHGIFSDIMEWSFLRTQTIRIDTHRDNHIMQHNLQKHGFSYCGIIYLRNGDERIAYQKTIQLAI